MNDAGTALERFLASRPAAAGIAQISEPRAFAHDESDYDRQYDQARVSTEHLRSEAAHVMDLCQRHGLAAGAPVLEVGCGTGRLSLGLAMHPGVGHLLVTDPSSAFCRITQRKLASIRAAAGRVDIGVLRAEDIAVLPAGAVTAIMLRSVLHHIADVDAFLGDCAGVLPPGGLLVCEEPYYEGYMMMGFHGQFIEAALSAHGYACTPEDRERVAYFIATMQFYGRRDVDKADAEDKHLFKPDELMRSGRTVGMDLDHYPNVSMTMSPAQNEQARSGYFQRFFADYVRYCMGWSESFARRVAEATRGHFSYFGPLEQGGHTTPACFGTFVFTKR